MSVLLLKSDLPQRDGRWLDAFAKERPGLEVRRWPDLGDASQIDYSLTWQLPHGVLSKLPNLKVIFSIGAGVDHLVRDPEVPRNLPLVRMVEAGLKQGMGEWVLFAVLQQHRDMLDYQAQQQRKIWSDLESYLASERPVGILGLGELGQHCAHLLKAVGFPVTGWSRSPKTVAGIPVLHGPDGLKKILQESRIVVSLLPLTPDTENLMNAERFAMMPRGAAFVNAGRGRQVVEEDLIAALDRGHLAGATLDVTRVEPLPKESPLWTHPRIFLTPHCAAQTIPETAVKAVAENIRRFEDGQPLQHLYDWVRGY